MPNDTDDQGEESADSEGMLVCIDRCAFGRLLTITAETIEYEDHGDFVVVCIDDFRWLENIAIELSREFARYDDDTY
jgi:hypothetical protein